MFCYVLNPASCTDDQLAAVANGSARVVRYIVEDANATKLFPEIFEGRGSSGDGSVSSGMEPSAAPLLTAELGSGVARLVALGGQITMAFL